MAKTNNLDMIEQVAMNCFSDGVISQWERYMNDNEVYFSSNTEENTHEQYEIYEKYLSLVERIIVNACEDINISQENFHRYCARNQNSPTVDVFCQLIVISTSFEAFSDIMKDRSKRSYMFQVFNSWKKTFSNSNSRVHK